MLDLFDIILIFIFIFIIIYIITFQSNPLVIATPLMLIKGGDSCNSNIVNANNNITKSNKPNDIICDGLNMIHTYNTCILNHKTLNQIRKHTALLDLTNSLLNQYKDSNIHIVLKNFNIFSKYTDLYNQKKQELQSKLQGKTMRDIEDKVNTLDEIIDERKSHKKIIDMRIQSDIKQIKSIINKFNNPKLHIHYIVDDTVLYHEDKHYVHARDDLFALLLLSGHIDKSQIDYKKSCLLTLDNFAAIDVQNMSLINPFKHYDYNINNIDVIPNTIMPFRSMQATKIVNNPIYKIYKYGFSHNFITTTHNLDYDSQYVMIQVQQLSS